MSTQVLQILGVPDVDHAPILNTFTPSHWQPRNYIVADVNVNRFHCHCCYWISYRSKSVRVLHDVIRTITGPIIWSFDALHGRFQAARVFHHEHVTVLTRATLLRRLRHWRRERQEKLCLLREMLLPELLPMVWAYIY